MLSTKPGQEQVFSLVLSGDRLLKATRSFLAPPLDNAVTICGCSRGPRRQFHAGVSSTEALSGPIPKHCLRIFFMRDTGSHQRVIIYLIILVGPYVDNSYCCALCLRERVVGRVEVARQF